MLLLKGRSEGEKAPTRVCSEKLFTLDVAGVTMRSVHRLEKACPMSENDTAFGKIIAKAWRDPVFKAELIANPVA